MLAILWLFFFGSREENALGLGRQLELCIHVLMTFMQQMNYKYICQPVAFYSEETINMLTWLLLAEDLWNLWIEFPWGDKYLMDWGFAI